MIFFLTLTVRGPFHRKDFKWKKYGGTGLISEKTEVLYAELNERAEAATGSYSVTGDSLQYIYSVPVTKNHCYFLTIIIMVTELLYQRKILCGCFQFVWLWLLLSVMKRCAEGCALQLYQTSLIHLAFIQHLLEQIWSTPICYVLTGAADLGWDTLISNQVWNCDGVVLGILMDHKF